MVEVRVERTILRVDPRRLGVGLVICKRPELPAVRIPNCPRTAGEHYWRMARLTVGTPSFANAMARVCASYAA